MRKIKQPPVDTALIHATLRAHALEMEVGQLKAQVDAWEHWWAERKPQ